MRLTNWWSCICFRLEAGSEHAKTTGKAPQASENGFGATAADRRYRYH